MVSRKRKIIDRDFIRRLRRKARKMDSKLMLWWLGFILVDFALLEWLASEVVSGTDVSLGILMTLYYC